MSQLPKLEINKSGRYTSLLLDGVSLKTVTGYQITEKADTKHCTLTVTMDIQKKFTCTCDTDEFKS
ncbi:MAG: hypothetical protein RSC99_03180 [Clostridiales bacterium]